MLVPLAIMFDKIKEKDLASIVYEDLDPEKFGEVLSLGVLKKSTHAKMLYLMSAGKHEEIREFLRNSESKTVNPLDKCNNLYRTGYVHFERGEYDKLPAIVRKYERLKAENPKLEYILNNFSVFDKYDAFADEDYEYVIEVCDIDLAENDTKKQNHKLTRVNVSFYRAVSLYKLGRFDEAKKVFEDLIAFAPKMYKAKLSQEFIDLIDSQNG
jgi:tetratricopeptide (TPR) repeat protein